jgi:hypothetical protein
MVLGGDCPGVRLMQVGLGDEWWSGNREEAWEGMEWRCVVRYGD